jgi:hypothetical protein
MRRISLALLLTGTLVLSACGGGGSTSAVECTQQYWNGVVGLCLPEGWAVLEQDKLAERGVPDQVMVAFQSTTVISGQTPTITVTSERLTAPLDSAAYSKASVRSVTTLPGYKLIDSRSIDVEGQKVDLHVFSAQPVANDPERRFSQVSAVAANVGYTVTALTPVSISDTLEKQVTLILSSLRFSEPTDAVSSK